MSDSDSPHLQFVTGRLAEAALRRVVERLADQHGFRYTIDVLPITVAALMTPAWIARHLPIRPSVTQVILPGYCAGDLSVLPQAAQTTIVVGPRDLHALPEFFGQSTTPREGYGQYSIEILAEINHAPRLSREEIRQQARRLQDDGADVIDLGCDPGTTWHDVAACVRELRDDGHRVSIDSMNVVEIEAAVRAGAELVLSVNRTNRHAAADWGCEVVAIPDDPADAEGLEETVAHLDRHGVPFRIDPSLLRYIHWRNKLPQAALMMGIGNVTELTDCDSAGVNVLLLALCEEWHIHSVLTTQVINWSRTSVRECDLARRLVHYAVQRRVLPKHLEQGLILLRDARRYELGPEELDQLTRSIRDSNYRLFAESDQLHLIARQLHLQDDDPFRLFQKLLATQPKNLDAAHAFYLGYELAKATTALTLSKQYRQDEALDWGYLTVPETRHPPSHGRPDSNSAATP
jgi:dihydropteroate synthase